MIGEVFTSNNFGMFTVTSYLGNSRFSVTFSNTGYVAKGVTKQQIKNGQIRDRMARTVWGVGIIGDGKHKPSNNGVRTKKFQVWNAMLQRCYSEDYQKLQPTYIGCTVCDEWHNFQVFADWFDGNYTEGFHLDKDKNSDGAKVYSPETCSFIPQRENTEIAHARNWEFVSPKGECVRIFNLSKFCRENKLDNSGMCKVHRGDIRSYKGWKKTAST